MSLKYLLQTHEYFATSKIEAKLFESSDKIGGIFHHLLDYILCMIDTSSPRQVQNPISQIISSSHRTTYSTYIL